MDLLFPWGHARRFNDYSTFIKKKFGGRVQKISVNVGFTCPNRDGTKGVGGCIYCDNTSFRPGYCEPQKSVSDQIKDGVSFFEKKYPDMQYMAYFQSYTNTYAPVNELRNLYEQAIIHPNVVALIIGTRPDCINEEIVKLLCEINSKIPVTVEFGIESTHDETLMRINRCHVWQDSVNAIQLCQKYGIETGGHLILGLPGEDESLMLKHAQRISALPIKTLKLHQLQVTKNTELAKQYKINPNIITLYTLEEYLNLAIRFIEILNPEIVLERFVSTSPVANLIAPHWNRMKNFEIVDKIEKALEKNNSWQGRLYQKFI